MLGMALTDKQQRFVDEYLIDLNATQAATRAGYEWPKTHNLFYVYLLIDPRDGHVFYVGKGKGYRFKSHVSGAYSGKHSNGAKDFFIREIMLSGAQVCEVIFADGMSEEGALACEKAMILLLREHGLTNISRGNITSRQSCAMRVDSLISAKTSYDVWIDTVSNQALYAVESVFGSPIDFYDWYSGQLTKLKEKVAVHG
jgi:hypothetical protein